MKFGNGDCNPDIFGEVAKMLGGGNVKLSLPKEPDPEYEWDILFAEAPKDFTDKLNTASAEGWTVRDFLIDAEFNYHALLFRKKSSIGYDEDEG